MQYAILVEHFAIIWLK